MSRPYKSKAIANYFIKKAKEEGDSITPMKLHKLIYYAHGWNLAINGDRLIDEFVEAWQYGPVVPSIYHELKKYGNNPVSGLIEDWNMNSRSTYEVDFSTPEIDEADSDTLEVLEKIWDIYGGYSAYKLSEMTHKIGTPWSKTVSQAVDKYGSLPNNLDIDDENIEDYFTNLATN